MDRFSKAELKAEIEKNLMLLFSVEPEQASDDQFYKATSLMVRNILTEKQKTSPHTPIQTAIKKSIIFPWSFSWAGR